MPAGHPIIAARIFNAPLMIHPAKLDAIAGALEGAWSATGSPTPQAYTTEFGEQGKGGYHVVDGVAVIEIFGVLAHRGGIQGDSSYVLGYQTIAKKLNVALGDPDVASIVLDISSPGGEVSGVFELADQIRAAKKQKPIYAIADSMTASAAYLIACACTEISVTTTGSVGSIGVVWRHADFSKSLENDGVSVTHIYAGDRKIDGHPYGALSDEVKANFQSDINKLYGMFVSFVAENRNMDDQAVRDTEAAIYMGEDAVRMGLADRLETADQLISRLSMNQTGAGSRQITTQRGDTMSEKETGGEPTAAAIMDKKAVAAKASAAARTEERSRVSAILNCEAATGRSALANHLAFETDMSAEQATVLLSKSPASAPIAEKSPLDAAMEISSQPFIGMDSPDADLTAAEQSQELASLIAGAGRKG